MGFCVEFVGVVLVVGFALEWLVGTVAGLLALGVELVVGVLRAGFD